MVSQFIALESDNFHGQLTSNEIPETGFHRQPVEIVAYLRVSTPQQDVHGQRLAILDYARKHGFRVDDFIETTASGRTSEARRRIDELMSALQPGDRLVVSELSRLARSLGQIVAILDTLAKQRISFVSIKENIRIEGKQDIQTKVMTTLFALFAEVERDLISERTREGLAKARASGKKLGRPKASLGVSRLDGKEDEIRRFLKLGGSSMRQTDAHGPVRWGGCFAESRRSHRGQCVQLRSALDAAPIAGGGRFGHRVSRLAFRSAAPLAASARWRLRWHHLLGGSPQR